jgi:uncharacterized protein (TIGR03663 family)
VGEFSSLKPWQTKLVAVLFFLGILSRLWGLGEKAFHHDESIHCFYSYQIATEGRFKGPNNTDVTFGYDPVYHGPFLYQFSGLIMFLLGDSDFTARLPFALMGILVLVLAWECRKLVGVPMAIGMLGAAALSPIVNYYSRFAREDINVCTAFFAVPVFAGLFLKERRSGYLILTALSLVIGYCMKESSYIYGFGLGAFAVAWGLVRLIRGGKPEFRSWFGSLYPFVVLLLLYALFSVFVFVFVAVDYHVDPKQHGFVGGVIDIANHAFSFKKLDVSGPELREKMKNQMRFFTDPSRSGVKTFYCVFAFLVSGAFLAGLEFLRHRFSAKPPPEAKPVKKKEAESVQPLDQSALPVGAIPLIACAFLAVLTAGFLSMMGVVAFIFAFLSWIGFEMVRSSYLRLDQDDPAAPLLIRIAAPWVTLASCIGLILLVYFFLFTQMFADPAGLKRGVYNYIEYWFGHQLGEYRLLGPFWFYIARLIIYEFAFLIVATVGVAAAVVIVAIKKWVRPLDFLTKAIELPGPFNPFFVLMIWMAFFNTIIYGYLHEKAPWLALHQALPWALVAGGVLGWSLSVWTNKWFRVFMLLTVGPLALLTLKAHIQVNHNWPDNIAELVSQQQADRDIRDMVKEVDRLAAETGLYEEFPIATEDEVEWPFPWYFRHYTKYRVKTADPTCMVQFGDDKTFNEMRSKLGDKFYWRKYLHRGAWIENSMDAGDLPGGEKFWDNVKAYWNNQLFKGKPFRLLFWNYFFHRERWSDINPKWGYVYIRKELLPTVEPIPAPPGSFDPPRRLVPELKQGPSGPGSRFNFPRGLHFDPQGNLHVVESLGGRVVVLSPSGTLTRSYGAPGSGPGQLKVDNTFGASNLAFDAEGNSYVADTWNHRVVKFDKAGKYLLAWGSGGEGSKPTAKFFGPRGIEVGPDGKVYVADTGDCEIEVFEPDGAALRKFGQRGLKKGDLDEPVGLKFGPEGNLYVCDTGNDRIEVFTPQGVYRNSWMVVGWNSEKVGMEPSIDFLPNGHVIVTLSKKNLIRVCSPKGDNVKNFELQGAKAEPIGVAVAKDGKVWLSDRITGQIFRVSIPE